MANNKKIDITFQAKGIKEIEKELDELQQIAKKITLTDDLNDQFQNLVDQAQEVKDALDSLKQAFSESTQAKGAKKNKSMTDMEKKIKDMKGAISNLTQQLGKANIKVDASMSKLDTAVAKLNDPKNFEGVLNQIQKVQEGFNTLIKLTNDYRNALSKPVEVTSSSSIDKEWLNTLEKIVNGEQFADENTRKMSDREIISMLRGMEKRVNELTF